MQTVLIKNGWLTTSSDTFQGDLFIEGERIVSLGGGIERNADITIDATGKYVFPGGIDAHVHMKVPCSDGSLSAGYETETISAAVGGTTTMIDYVLPERGQTLWQTVSRLLGNVAKPAAIDYGLHVIIVEANAKTAGEIGFLAEKGITSFKLFMANDIALQDQELYRFMEEIKRNGCTACVHAENKDIISYLQKRHVAQGEVDPYYHALSRPAQAEIEAIHRALVFAEITECPTVIAHISTREGMRLVREAKERGLMVFGETCPHYLLLDEEKYRKGDYESAKYVLSPPLRNQRDISGLWQGVKSSGIDLISSDHNGFSYATHKQLGQHDFRLIPNGAPGIEHRFSLMYHYGLEYGLEPTRFVELVAANPAKIFGLYPKKGTLAPGSDADIVIFDPNVEQIISAENQHQRSDYTPYEQFRLRGKVDTVFLRGHLLVHDGDFVGSSDSGHYVVRTPRTQEVKVIPLLKERTRE